MASGFRIQFLAVGGTGLQFGTLREPVHGHSLQTPTFSVAMLHLLSLYRVHCNHGRLTQLESVSDGPWMQQWHAGRRLGQRQDLSAELELRR